MIGEEDSLGALTVGRTANVSILDDPSGTFTFRDNGGVELECERMLQPAFRLRGGTRFAAVANILPRLPA